MYVLLIRYLSRIHRTSLTSAYFGLRECGVYNIYLFNDQYFNEHVIFI
jgi:hypothetical protein